jgi:hypothetical protein
MPYEVRADRIAVDVSDEVRDSIIQYLQTYSFPYVTTVNDKAGLRSLFIEHFQNRHNLDWLKDRIYSIASSRNLQGVAAVPWSETNRLHTAGLGNLLLRKGQTTCTTIHSYGDRSMSDVCRRNLEGKTLNIGEIITNSFPQTRDELGREDVPMIPQHFNCRHVMAPLVDI